MRHVSPVALVVLVGTQSDLRQVLIQLARQRERPVSVDKARLVARGLGVTAFAKCSALTQKNLKVVFDTAIVVSLEHKEKMKGLRQRPRLTLREKTPNNPDNPHRPGGGMSAVSCEDFVEGFICHFSLALSCSLQGDYRADIILVVVDFQSSSDTENYIVKHFTAPQYTHLPCWPSCQYSFSSSKAHGVPCTVCVSHTQTFTGIGF